ncbi:MAG: hypothetical protein M0T79_07995 [Actinomycetota bacterium]|nr:hypothetical protein [Actinomycetota bacterium]
MAVDVDGVLVGNRALDPSCSASRESLPTGAGRLETGRSGVTTFTGWSSAPSEARELAPVDVVLLGSLPEVAARTVTGPGSLIAEDGTPTLTATAAAVAATSTARTAHMVRMHPFSYRTGGRDTRAVGWSRNTAESAGGSDSRR